MLSVILPCYNEGENNIKRAYDTISKILTKKKIDFEIIFVNDGSSDNTWNSIAKISHLDKRIRGINFSRNFGKESALFAGLQYSKGDCCVTLDCDLQHPPEVIISMYHLWQKGYEIVEGVKSSRGKESFFHSFCARSFYNVLNKIMGLDMSKASDFKLLDRKVVNVLLSMPERQMFYRALTFWMGFNKTEVEFDVLERVEGNSKWSTMSLIKYAIKNITSFSTSPMQIITIMGFFFFVLAMIIGIISIVKYITGSSLEGFTTVILLLLIIGSILMISLGIIGYYIAKIYEEIKGRPRFIVDNFCGGENEK